MKMLGLETVTVTVRRVDAEKIPQSYDFFSKAIYFTVFCMRLDYRQAFLDERREGLGMRASTS